MWVLMVVMFLLVLGFIEVYFHPRISFVNEKISQFQSETVKKRKKTQLPSIPEDEMTETI